MFECCEAFVTAVKSVVNLSNRTPKFRAVLLFGNRWLNMCTCWVMFMLLHLQNSPTWWGIFMPLYLTNSPTSWGILMSCFHNKLRLHGEVYFCPVPVPYTTRTPSTNLQNTISLHCQTKRYNKRSCVSPSRCLTSHRNVTEPVWMFLQDLLSEHHLGNRDLQTLMASLACQNFVASILCILLEGCFSVE